MPISPCPHQNDYNKKKSTEKKCLFFRGFPDFFVLFSQMVKKKNIMEASSVLPVYSCCASLLSCTKYKSEIFCFLLQFQFAFGRGLGGFLDLINCYCSLPLFMIPLVICEYFVTSAVVAAVTFDLWFPYE